MHIDAWTNLVTVYSQSKMLGKVVAPAQLDPGEFTQQSNGERVASHPDAVYLNGSGQELTKDDGTIEEMFVLNWKHKNDISPFNGLKRSMPNMALFNRLEGDNNVE